MGCQLCECRFSGIVVVKIAIDDAIIFENRDSLVDVADRVEYDCIRSVVYAKCKRREIINKSLEHCTLC